MYFQLPWLPERSASWVIPRLWRRWSPGYRRRRRLAPRRRRDWRTRDGGAPRSGTTARPSVAAGRPAQYAELHEHWLSAPRLPTLYLHGTDDGCCRHGLRAWIERVLPDESRCRDRRERPGTSCSSISPTSSRVTSSTSLGRRASLAIRISHSAAGVKGCRAAALRLLQAGMVARDERQQEPPRQMVIEQRRDAVGSPGMITPLPDAIPSTATLATASACCHRNFGSAFSRLLVGNTFGVDRSRCTPVPGTTSRR